MLNRIIVFLTCLLLSMSANASSMSGMFTFYYLLFVIAPALLVHILAIIGFSIQGYYQSKKFTMVHLMIAMLVPIVGIGIMMFEYSLSTGLNQGDIEAIIFGIVIYSFLIFIFAIPYHLHRNSSNSPKK